MTEQKRKGYQGIRATEAFEYENTRSDFNYCYYWEHGDIISIISPCWEKWKTMSD